MAGVERLRSWLACTVLVAGAGCATALADEEASPAPSGITVEVLASAQLPTEFDFGTVGGLSGLVAAGPHAGDANEFLVVSDDRKLKRFYRLTIDLRKDDAGAYTLGVDLDRPVEMRCEPSDSEAIVGVLAQGERGPGILVGFERPPSVIEFSLDALGSGGRAVEGEAAFEMPPEVLEHVRHNRGIEGMAWRMAPNDWGAAHPGLRHDSLWVGMEAAIESDGPEATAENPTLCRVLEFTSAGLPDRQFFYETEPAPRGIGGTKTFNSLGEMCGLGDGRVLFLERGASIPAGWHADLFVCNGATETRKGVALPVLVKRHVASLRDAGLPVMGNLEGMAVGAPLAELLADESERGRILLLIADDNFGKDGQVGSQVVACRITGVE